MPDRSERGETEIRYCHQDQADQHRFLHAQPRVEKPADEHADQQRPEAHADVVNRDLVLRIAEVLEEQAKRQIGQRVAEFVDQDEDENEQRALALEEFGQRADIGDRRRNRTL